MLNPQPSTVLVSPHSPPSPCQHHAIDIPADRLAPSVNCFAIRAVKAGRHPPTFSRPRRSLTAVAAFLIAQPSQAAVVTRLRSRQSPCQTARRRSSRYFCGGVKGPALQTRVASPQLSVKPTPATPHPASCFAAKTLPVASCARACSAYWTTALTNQLITKTLSVEHALNPAAHDIDPPELGRQIAIT
jgi:hypothetical protein